MLTRVVAWLLIWVPVTSAAALAPQRLPARGRFLRDLPHEDEVDELLGQIWVDAVARDEDAVEERTAQQIDQQVLVNLAG
jgi:hypothetical protein